MENQIVVKEKNGMTLLAKIGATGALIAASAGAFAEPLAIDVTDVAASLTGLIVPIGVVGAAYLGVRVAIRGWKTIRGVV